MYVLSMDNGYVQIEQNEKGGYDLIEYEGGTVCKLKIGKRNKDVHIIPIGQIVTDGYNKKLQSYMDAGGTVEEILQIHKTGKIKIAAPYVPLWIYPKKKPAEQSITNMDFADMPYIKVCYIQFMGELTPVFAVSNLSELYFYDLFRMKTAGVLIRECADCGRAFIAKTTAVRCEDCRKAGMGEQKKRNNLKSDPARNLLHKIKDRAKKRDSSPEYQYGYYNSLHNLIADTTDALTGNQLLEKANEINTLDSTFWKLHRYMKSDYCAVYDEEIYKQWEKERYTMFTQENPEQWLRDWYNKAGCPFDQ